MNSNLKFEFVVNKENNTIVIKREFAADIELVWEAWTNPKILDQWWGPKPYRSETKTMDFREGGFRLYAMVSPQDEKHWGRENYEKIVLRKNFSGTDVFCDENGNTTPEFPQGRFENAFSEAGSKTLVTITSTHNSLEDLEKIIEMGYKEGITVCLQQLDEELLTLKK